MKSYGPKDLFSRICTTYKPDLNVRRSDTGVAFGFPIHFNVCTTVYECALSNKNTSTSKVLMKRRKIWKVFLQP